MIPFGYMRDPYTLKNKNQNVRCALPKYDRAGFPNWYRVIFGGFPRCHRFLSPLVSCCLRWITMRTELSCGVCGPVR